MRVGHCLSILEQDIWAVDQGLVMTPGGVGHALDKCGDRRGGKVVLLDTLRTARWPTGKAASAHSEKILWIVATRQRQRTAPGLSHLCHSKGPIRHVDQTVQAKIAPRSSQLWSSTGPHGLAAVVAALPPRSGSRLWSSGGQGRGQNVRMRHMQRRRWPGSSLWMVTRTCKSVAVCVSVRPCPIHRAATLADLKESHRGHRDGVAQPDRRIHDKPADQVGPFVDWNQSISD